MLSGNCLCGAVSFRLRGETSDIYQCHCSKCRKAMGSASGSICLSSGENFDWVSGEDQIRTFEAPSGYYNAFCSTCGSPLPHSNPEKTTYWVPAGLLNDKDPGIKVFAHVFVDSKASWDEIGDSGIQYSENFPT